ncbi:hypothetical protein GSF70_12910 [Flavobacteriaceae bacterium W22]|nr:hypothetical protein [Flavobacteriaceae bacterium W22]
MKKFVLISIILLCLVFFYIIQSGTLLKYESKYSLLNDSGNVVPAKIYSRTIKSKINGKNQEIYQILVFFNDNQNMKSFNPILFIPKQNIVGVVESGKKDFLFFGNKAFQKSDKSNKFTSLTNSLFFDSNPPIYKISFNDKEIVFNSFNELKVYGETLTLKLR